LKAGPTLWNLVPVWDSAFTFIGFF
jgi:hypothetical protein